MASTFDNHDQSPGRYPTSRYPTGRHPAHDPDLRIGDADRERVANVVSDAAAVGYLDLSELDERLETVWSARTAGQLAQATADLPPEWLRGRERPRRPSPSRPASRPARRPANPAFQRRLAAYLVGMSVMVSIWLAVGITQGSWYPWVVWPALGWGISVFASGAGCGRPAVSSGNAS